MIMGGVFSRLIRGKAYSISLKKQLFWIGYNNFHAYMREP